MKMARRIMTKKEIRDRTPIFQSDGWNVRKEEKKLKSNKGRNNKKLKK